MTSEVDAPVEPSCPDETVADVPAFDDEEIPQRVKVRKRPPNFATDILELSKPGILAMCVFEALGGMYLATLHSEVAAAFTWSLVCAAMLATAFSVASANTLNQYMEREGDRKMRRTQDRPLPSGRMKPAVALVWAGLTGAASVVIFWWWVNPLSALLSLFALLSYVLVYTPLKRRSTHALAVGAIPGAIPPLLGWTSATGVIEAPGVVLFLILAIWQLPHFLAIAIYRDRDYREAGIRTVVAVRGVDQAKIQALVYSLILFPVTLLLLPLGVAGGLYLTVATALGLWFFIFALRGFEPGAGNRWARRFFFASLLYLPALTVALALDVALLDTQGWTPPQAPSQLEEAAAETDLTEQEPQSGQAE